MAARHLHGHGSVSWPMRQGAVTCRKEGTAGAWASVRVASGGGHQLSLTAGEVCPLAGVACPPGLLPPGPQGVLGVVLLLDLARAVVVAHLGVVSQKRFRLVLIVGHVVRDLCVVLLHVVGH